MQFIVFVLVTALVGGIAWWASRRTPESTADGFYLGGRSLGPWVVAGSLLLTNLSTEQIVGLNGGAYREGILVMAWETLAAVAMVVTALFLLPRYLGGQLTTIPEFLEKRFDRQVRMWVSALFVSGYAIILLPIVLYSGALAINGMFDVPALLGMSKIGALWVTVWALGVIGSIYAIFGGLKAVAVSDAINAIGLLIGGLAIPILGLLMIGEGDLSSGWNTLTGALPEAFKAKGDTTSSIPFSTLFTGMMLVQLFYWGTNQAIIQRALAARSLKAGQQGLMIAAVVKIAGPLIVVLPGIIALYLFGPNLEGGDEAYPLLVAKVLPKWAVGFFAAVLFGAILSSFNSALNSVATLVGFDLYKGWVNPEANEIQSVKAGKCFAWVIALMAMTVAPFLYYASKGLFDYLQEVNGFYNIPILTLIVVGYLTRKVPARGAKVALLSGVVLYGVSQFILKPYFTETYGEHTYPHFLHVMAILFVLNVLIMLAFGWGKPAAELPESTSGAGQAAGAPWKAARWVGATVVLIVVSTYFIFT